MNNNLVVIGDSGAIGSCGNQKTKTILYPDANYLCFLA